MAAVQVRNNLAYEFNSLAGTIGSIFIQNYKIAITSKYRISNQPAFPVAREAQ